MKRRPARVLHGRLELNETTSIGVGTPIWYRWLSAERSFAYLGPEGSFTARRSADGPGGYWRAYKKVNGRVRSVYLGRPQDVTAERLATAARQLAPEQPPAAVRGAVPAIAPVNLGPFLYARLQPPPLRPERLLRERLFMPLRDDARRVVLVIGPPGSGKSTLIADWAAVDRRVIAWLTLDPDDNDPHRLLAAAATALGGLQPEVALRTRTLLDPAQPTPVMTIGHVLAADLAAQVLADHQHRPAILVFDDYHVISNPQIHELVLFLLERRIPALRIIVLSRTAPPLPLRRLHARNELTEIRGADLAFTTTEARCLLQTLAPNADEALIQTLIARTEGWPAALELAAFALQHTSGAGPAESSELPGIAALIEEALAGLAPDVRRLLLSIAVLDQVCPELCAAVVGQRSAQRAARALHTLARANLFVLPLGPDGRWFRLHRLVAEELLRQLRTLAPERERVLRRRAAAWYEREGFAAEAVAHALAAQAWGLAARVIEHAAEPLWRQGAIATLERWLQQLPQAIVLQHPLLAVIQAWAAATQGDLGRAEALLETIKQNGLLDGSGEPDVAAAAGRAVALRAKIARMRGDGDQARRLGRHVLELFPATEGSWRATALVDLAVATFLDDRPAEALELFQTAAALAQAHQNHHTALMALFHQASTLLAMGQLTAAQSVGARATGLAALWGVSDLPVNAFADLHTALIAYERDELGAADQAINRGLALLQHSNHTIMEGQLHLVRALVGAGRGDADATRSALDTAEECYLRAGTLHEPKIGWRRRFLAAWRSSLLARVGQVEQVHLWLHAHLDAARPPLASWIYRAHWLAVARAHLMAGEPETARRVLEALCERAEATGAGDVLVKLLVLLAQAEQQLGNAMAVEAALGQAIRRGAGEGYVRSVIDEAEPLLPVLRALVKRPGAPAYASVLLRRLQGGQFAVPELRDLLTARECEVAELIVAGYANAAIAERLMLSNGTVKWHVSNILGKLGLRRRTEVVARLSVLGLASQP